MAGVFAAFRSNPDYFSSGRHLKSLHDSLDGAIKSLYPDGAEFREASFLNRKGWIGPDGFGEIEYMEILP